MRTMVNVWGDCTGAAVIENLSRNELTMDTLNKCNIELPEIRHELNIYNKPKDADENDNDYNESEGLLTDVEAGAATKQD